MMLPPYLKKIKMISIIIGKQIKRLHYKQIKMPTTEKESTLERI